MRENREVAGAARCWDLVVEVVGWGCWLLGGGKGCSAGVKCRGRELVMVFFFCYFIYFGLLRGVLFVCVCVFQGKGGRGHADHDLHLYLPASILDLKPLCQSFFNKIQPMPSPANFFWAVVDGSALFQGDLFGTMSLHTQDHRRHPGFMSTVRTVSISCSSGGTGFGREAVDWKGTKTRIAVSVSKESTCLQINSIIVDDLGLETTQPVRIATTTRRSSRRYSPHRTTPKTTSHPAENIPAADSSSRPLGPRKHQTGTPNHPPSSPTCIPKRIQNPIDLASARRSRSRDGGDHKKELAGAGPAIGIRGRVGRTRDPGATCSRPTLA